MIGSFGVSLLFLVLAKNGIHVSTHLIQNGRELAHWENQNNITTVVPPGKAGVFRVEVRLRYQGRLRGWIYSNPIYLRA